MFLALKVGNNNKFEGGFHIVYSLSDAEKHTMKQPTYSYLINCYEMKTIIGIIHYNIELLFFRYLACEYLPLLMSQKESY